MQGLFKYLVKIHVDNVYCPALINPFLHFLPKKHIKFPISHEPSHAEYPWWANAFPNANKSCLRESFLVNIPLLMSDSLAYSPLTWHYLLRFLSESTTLAILFIDSWNCRTWKQAFQSNLLMLTKVHTWVSPICLHFAQIYLAMNLSKCFKVQIISISTLILATCSTYPSPSVCKSLPGPQWILPFSLLVSDLPWFRLWPCTLSISHMSS